MLVSILVRKKEGEDKVRGLVTVIPGPSSMIKDKDPVRIFEEFLTSRTGPLTLNRHGFKSHFWFCYHRQ